MQFRFIPASAFSFAGNPSLCPSPSRIGPGGYRNWQDDCTYSGVSRLVSLIFMALMLPAAHAAIAQPEQKTHPYRQHWKSSTVGKVAVGGVVAKAAFGQMLGHPRNYGGGVDGFGKRLGAGFAAHAVKTTVEHVIAAPLHEDLRYHRSNQVGFRPRILYALKGTVITHNTKSGNAHPAVGRLSGHAAAGTFSQLALHAGSGATTAGVGLAAEAGMNVAREFWPRHHSERR